MEASQNGAPVQPGRYHPVHVIRSSMARAACCATAEWDRLFTGENSTRRWPEALHQESNLYHFRGI